ncbi:2b32deed-1525-4473-a97a-4184f8228580 [Sclerotinia trifoliorum]|uniref:2b32deed-1525-4473-a97a-4184f8228580 n=1 Tax=Sclerotinia trifoliorum TaxID=28548 RepID=A0A8H2ZQV9_9HELO|nr:2b32deed-1525-4473-a97a-4184f8228580 [Sclerotinia trifoliorum]
MGLFPNRKRQPATPAQQAGVISPQGRTTDKSSDRTLTSGHENPNYTSATGVDIKRATKARKTAIYISSFLYVVSIVFLILTIIGNINDRPVIRNTWFFRLDLTNIIPESVGGSITLTNSLARSLGLHDFYQVGLWNFCEGYNDEGITSCSEPQKLYWFNPVDILLNELLPGATIALPAQINNILSLIRIASHIMFGFFITGVAMNFCNIFLCFFTIYSRWISGIYATWAFISALLTTVAAIIATVMFIIFRNVITSQAGLNIGASIGDQMFVFMWIGAACSIINWVIHVGMCCCGASRRDVKNGRRMGSKKAYSSGALMEEKNTGTKKRHFPAFKRTKTPGEIV